MPLFSIDNSLLLCVIEKQIKRERVQLIDFVLSIGSPNC